jgi:hypothetical protein
MRLRGVIVLLCLPAGLVACGSNDVSRDELIRAAAATRDAGGARISEYGVIAPGIDRSYRYTATGIMDARGSTDITNRFAPPGQGVTRAITIGNTSYFSYPGQHVFDKKWASVESKSSASNLLAGLDPTDPGAIARVFDLADLRLVGNAQVRGVPTTHYEARIDLRDLARLASPAAVDAYQRAMQQGGGGSLRVDLWVDDKDLIRRMRKRFRTRLTGIDYPPDDQTTEYFDFGLNERVVPPPKRDTETLGP